MATIWFRWSAEIESSDRTHGNTGEFGIRDGEVVYHRSIGYSGWTPKIEVIAAARRLLRDDERTWERRIGLGSKATPSSDVEILTCQRSICPFDEADLMPHEAALELRRQTA